MKCGAIYFNLSMKHKTHASVSCSFEILSDTGQAFDLRYPCYVVFYPFIPI